MFEHNFERAILQQMSLGKVSQSLYFLHSINFHRTRIRTRTCKNKNVELELEKQAKLELDLKLDIKIDQVCSPG